MSTDLALKIRNTALQLGFDGCGIVGLKDLQEYEQQLEQRMLDCPDSKPMLDRFRKYAKPESNYPWARAVIVCISDYSKYAVPEQLEGLIGKYYFYDHHMQPQTLGGRMVIDFEEQLGQMGVKWVRETYGVTSNRLAAAKAGLGIIRKNNFFYNQQGSRTVLETWLIDKELEWSETNNLKPCPDECTKCIDACPTKALSKHYCTDMASCVCWLTWGVQDLIPEERMKQVGKWIYGCDLCQDACPMNAKAPQGSDDFPDLRQWAEGISLPAIMEMDTEQIKEKLLPKLWYIQPEKFWLWKVNALRAMTNSYKPEYSDSILRAVDDENAKVREMALRAKHSLGI